MKDKKEIRLTFRVPPELHAQLKQVAKENYISINSFILQAVSQKIKRVKKSS